MLNGLPHKDSYIPKISAFKFRLLKNSRVFPQLAKVQRISHCGVLSSNQDMEITLHSKVQGTLWKRGNKNVQGMVKM